MKISIVTGPWLPVPALRGGAMQKSWHMLARELAGQGHDVTIVARAFPRQASEEMLDGVRVLRPRGFSQSGKITADLFKDLLYAVNLLPRLPRADVLVTNSFWLPVLAVPFRRSAGKVVVSAARFPKGQFRLYRGAALIVAISGAVREAIVGEQPKLAARTVVVPLPVELERFAAARPERARAERTLLFAGRIHPEKGIELLLRAFREVSAQFPHWRLRLVGPINESEGGGGDRFATAMCDLATGLPVEWGGAIWDAGELASTYAAADLFAYPSIAERGEAFGVAALESMAAGTPPVVSNLSCFRDFVRDDENGWVFDHRSPRPAEALASTLRRAMGDEAALRRCGEGAGATAARFGVPAIAQALLSELEHVVLPR